MFRILTILIMTLGLPAFFSIARAEENPANLEYIKSLFAPHFLCESVRIEKRDWSKVVDLVYKVKGKMDPQVRKKTAGEHLDIIKERGVSFHHTTREEYISIVKPTNDGTNTVLVSTCSYKEKDRIISCREERNEICYSICKDLGVEWTRIEILPEKEAITSEPPLSRYPGAVLRSAYHWPKSEGGGWIFNYGAKASIMDVANFCNDLLTKEFKKPPVVYSYQDTSWRKSFEIEVFGIKTTGVYINYFLNAGPGLFTTIRIKQSDNPFLRQYVSIEYRFPEF